MTGPAPVSGDDSTRERLADLFLKHWRTSTSGCYCGQMNLGESYTKHLADVVQPHLDRIADERAAGALEEVARDLTVGLGVGAYNPASPYVGPVAADLRARAAALRARTEAGR